MLRINCQSEVAGSYGRLVALVFFLCVGFGAVQFAYAEVEPVDVYVLDKLSQAPIEGTRVRVYRQPEGSSRRNKIGMASTDVNGRVQFSIDYSLGDIIFTARPHKVNVESEPFGANPGSVTLRSGNVGVITQQCIDGTPQVKTKVQFYLPGGSSPVNTVSSGKTGIAVTEWDFAENPEVVLTTSAITSADPTAVPLQISAPGIVTLCTDHVEWLAQQQLEEAAAFAGDYGAYQLLGRLTYGLTPDDIESNLDFDTLLAQQLETSGGAACLDQQQFISEGSLLLESKTFRLDRLKPSNMRLYVQIAGAINPCGLREVMTQFWDNHFATGFSKNADYASRYLVDQNQTIKMINNDAQYMALAWEYAEHVQFKAHALGNFRDLLGVSAYSPAMSVFLDVITGTTTPNENYARELMELHTLGVGGGYTQQDIVELARVFTGRSLRTDEEGVPLACDEALHDYGTVELDLGLASPLVLNARNAQTSSCADDVDWVLDQLVAHPATAQNVCRKLVQKLLREDPPTDVVQACADTFTENLHAEDQIAQMVETIVRDESFVSRGEYLGKIKTPLELAVSILRALELVDYGVDFSDLSNYLRSPNLNMDLFDVGSPDGYSEQDAAWFNSGLLVHRIRLINHLVYGGRDPGKNEVLVPYFDPVTYFESHGVTTASEVIDFMMQLTRSDVGGFSAELRMQAEDILANERAFDIADVQADSKLRQVVSLFLSSPNFQLQ